MIDFGYKFRKWIQDPEAEIDCGTFELCEQKNNDHILHPVFDGDRYLHAPGIRNQASSFTGFFVYHDDPDMGGQHQAKDS